MKIKIYIPIYAILLLIVMAVVFYFSMNAAWIGDEIYYCFKITPTFISDSTTYFEPFQEIQDISDLFASQNNHYMHFTGNGRYVAHLVVQMFLAWFGQPAFAICNALMYATFIILLCKFTQQKLSSTRIVILAIIMIFLSYIIKFVPTTQIGYIWSSVINLYFLILLFGKNRKLWQVIPLIVLSLAAGNSNESFSSGISIALIFYMILHWRELSVQKWIMIFFYGLGALIILGAAGLGNRVAESSTISKDVFAIIINACTSFTAIIILLIVIGYNLLKGRLILKNFITDNIFFLIAMCTCILLCLFTGNISLRPLLGANLMAIIILFRTIRPENIKSMWLWMGSFAVLLLWIYQGFYMYGQKQKLDYINEEFVKSKNGTIYIDLYPTTPLSGMFSYGCRLDLYETDSVSTARDRLLHMALQAKYYTDKELKVYPEFLKGKDNVELENQIIKVHYGVYLIIVKDGTKPAVSIMRGLDLGVLSIPYDTFVPTFDIPIKKGKNWKAYMVYDDMYVVSNLSAEIDGKSAHE